MPTRCSPRRSQSATRRRARRQPVGPILYTEDAVEAIVSCLDASSEKATVVLFVQDDFFVRTGVVVNGRPADNQSVQALIATVQEVLENNPDVPYIVVGLWTVVPGPPDFEFEEWMDMIARWNLLQDTDPNAPEVLDLVLIDPTGYTKFKRESRF